MNDFDALVAVLDAAVVVVTAADGDDRDGCLVGFHSQCSIDPPRYAVWLSRANRTFDLAQRTDLLAFTSLYEEWGYALLEAFSQGVPALAFDLYPFFEIVSPESGLLAAPRDPAALAAAIDGARSAGLPDPASVLASATARFGSESVVERLIPVYEELAAATARRSR